ncbi:hypothetical protein B0H17DRAFT_1082327 [Mycena rosella]|uniref:Uncharacterized protein n=1 Tax=Mycena rosella TaxID=1033263 RepID=A0AAD7D2U3_MYCRO|nr:hypothetical protein B0H17DRAFT_1082327 [Mycena rosella]
MPNTHSVMFGVYFRMFRHSSELSASDSKEVSCAQGSAMSSGGTLARRRRCRRAGALRNAVRGPSAGARFSSAPMDSRSSIGRWRSGPNKWNWSKGSPSSASRHVCECRFSTSMNCPSELKQSTTRESGRLCARASQVSSSATGV